MGNLAAVLDREAEVRWVSRKMMPEPLVWIFLLGNRSPGIVIGFPPQRESLITLFIRALFQTL